MRSAPARPAIAVFLGVFLVGLVFALYTQHAWEDYWITYRASKNLATGHGLVFVPGERLQTYTSPLGVLIPAFFCWMTGTQSDQLALWLFRLTSLGALATGIFIFFKVLRHLELRPVSCFLVVALMGLDPKTVDFSINGMETGLMIFFLGLSIHGLIINGPRQFIRLGIGWAGLMWTRPDSFIHIGALCLASFIFIRGNARNASLWKIFLSAGLICLLAYLPWFLWAWHYYGSPVPQTILAKATTNPALTPAGFLMNVLLFPFKNFALPNQIHGLIFGPIYAILGGWPPFLEYFGALMAGFLSLAWLIPLFSPRARMFSLTFFLGLLYLGAIVQQPAPWYMPPVAALGYLTLGLLFDEALSFAAKLPQWGWHRGWFRHLEKILRTLPAILIGSQAMLLACTGREMAVQQALIEDGMRKPLGLWLRDHAHSPHDTVLLEPLGYIGYYSQLKMFDYPGLSSREMLETRLRFGRIKQNTAYLELKPDWIVLRRHELYTANPVMNAERLTEFYEPAVMFDATEKVSATDWLPGRGYLQYDQVFYIFHRKQTPVVDVPSGAGATNLIP
jgi:hypothetical protein